MSSLIAFVFESIFFWYCFHYLLFIVWAVQNIIHLPNKSRTYIQLFVRIYLRNLLYYLDNLSTFFLDIVTKLTALWPPLVEADVNVPTVRPAMSKKPSLLPVTMAPHCSLSFVEFEIAPFAPSPPDWKGVDLQVVFQ